jgi:hypothetical protein
MNGKLRKNIDVSTKPLKDSYLMSFISSHL